MIGQNIKFFADGINLSCALKNFAPDGQADMLDNTTLCTSGARSFVPGLKNGTLQAEGIWDSDSTEQDKIHDVMSAAFDNGTSKVFTASYEAIAVGNVALMLKEAKVQNYGVNSPIDALIMASVALQANRLTFGKFIYSGSANDALDTGASYDEGAETYDGGLFQAHFYKESDSSALEALISLEQSPNNSTWAEIYSGTINAESGAVTTELSGTVNRYTRVKFTPSDGKGYCVAALARY